MQKAMNKTKLEQTETNGKRSPELTEGRSLEPAEGRTIGGIPEGWKLVLLKDVAVVNEKAIDKKYSHNEIEYIDIASVDKGRILEVKKLLRSEAPSRAQRIVRKNDILISTVRPNLKHFAFVKKANSDTIASTGFAVISTKKVNPRFLYYYLTTDRYTDFLSSIADSHTSTYPAFNPDILKNSEIPFPPEDEQRTIAKILGDLDEKIELNHQMNKTLEAMGQAIFKHWFIDFEFPNEQDKPYKSSGGKMVDTESGKIPEGWTIKPIGAILELAYGKALKEDRRQSGNIPVYGSNGQVGWHNEALVKGPGIVIGRKGNPGIVTWAPIDFFPIDTSFYVIIKDSKLSMCYLLYALSNIDLASLGADSAVPGLNRNIACNTEILVPSAEVVKEFDRIVKLLLDKVLMNDQEINILISSRDSLLPKLMSGEIRI